MVWTEILFPGFKGPVASLLYTHRFPKASLELKAHAWGVSAMSMCQWVPAGVVAYVYNIQGMHCSFQQIFTRAIWVPPNTDKQYFRQAVWTKLIALPMLRVKLKQPASE